MVGHASALTHPPSVSRVSPDVDQHQALRTASSAVIFSFASSRIATQFAGHLTNRSR